MSGIRRRDLLIRGSALALSPIAVSACGRIGDPAVGSLGRAIAVGYSLGGEVTDARELRTTRQSGFEHGARVTLRGLHRSELHPGLLRSATEVLFDRTGERAFYASDFVRGRASPPAVGMFVPVAELDGLRLRFKIVERSEPNLIGRVQLALESRDRERPLRPVERRTETIVTLALTGGDAPRLAPGSYFLALAPDEGPVRWERTSYRPERRQLVGGEFPYLLMTVEAVQG